MPGGLEAIAMAALQELQGSSNRAATADETSDDIKEAVIGSNNVPTLTTLPSTAARVVSKGLDDETKAPSLFMQQMVGNSTVLPADRRGPSSPAVVSSTSQEEDDDKNPSLMGREKQAAAASAAARVVSLETMAPSSTPFITTTTTNAQELDVADQVLAVLHGGESREIENLALEQYVRLSSPPPVEIPPWKKSPTKKKLPVKKAAPVPAVVEKPSTPPPAAFAAESFINASSAVDIMKDKATSAETEAYFSNILADPEKFLLTSQPHFSSCLNKTINTKTVITDGVQPNDVLCGRGGETNHHAYVVIR